MIFSTIHISSVNIKLMAIKGNSIFKWDVVPLEPGLVRDGRIVDPPRVGEMIENLFQSASVPKSNVIITVSGLPYTYRVMDFPRMNPVQLQEAMNTNLSSEFSVPIENLYISWAPVNFKPDTIEYFVMAVDRQFVDSIIETAKFARISNWSLDIRPLALARAAAQSDAIIVSLDNDYVDMVLVQGGQVKDMHSANVEMDMEGANRGNYINMFSSELSKLISYHSNTKTGETLASDIPVIVTGETLAILQKTDSKEDFLEELRNATGYPVQFLDTWISFPGYFVGANYATNLGLALRRLKNKAKTKNEFHDIKLDMLRGQFGKKPQTLAIAYIILPALVVIAVVIILSVTSARSQNKTEIADLQSKLNIANQSLVQARAGQAEDQTIQDQIDTAVANLQTSVAEYDQLLGNKGNNAPNLTHVTAALPAGADFVTIAMNDDQIRITGRVVSPFDVITYIASLKSAGYNVLNIEFIDEKNTETGLYQFTVVITQSTGSNAQ